MLHGTRGNYAPPGPGAAQHAKLEAIQGRGQSFATDVAPTRGTDPVQSGGLLNQQTRGRAEDLMKTGGKSIEDAINEGVIVDTERLKGLPTELEGKLTATGPVHPRCDDRRRTRRSPGRRRTRSTMRSRNTPTIRTRSTKA